jgi:hypothetical protein
MGLPFFGKTFHMLIYLLVVHNSDREDKKDFNISKNYFYTCIVNSSCIPQNLFSVRRLYPAPRNIFIKNLYEIYFYQFPANFRKIHLVLFVENKKKSNFALRWNSTESR